MDEHRVSFRLSIADGTIVDEASPENPLIFTFGDMALAPCLEACIKKLNKGEKKTFLLAPEYAFGHPSCKNEQVIKQDEFPQEIEQKEGALIEFTTPTGIPVIGVIDKIMGDDIFVDFNHPLAGHDLSFEVELL